MAAQHQTPRKPCYKCGNPVPVTYAEAANGQRHTTCPACKEKLQVEWDHACAVIAKKTETAA